MLEYWTKLATERCIGKQGATCLATFTDNSVKIETMGCEFLIPLVDLVKAFAYYQVWFYYRNPEKPYSKPKPDIEKWFFSVFRDASLKEEAIRAGKYAVKVWTEDGWICEHNVLLRIAMIRVGRNPDAIRQRNGDLYIFDVGTGFTEGKLWDILRNTVNYQPDKPNKNGNLFPLSSDKDSTETKSWVPLSSQEDKYQRKMKQFGELYNFSHTVSGRISVKDIRPDLDAIHPNLAEATHYSGTIIGADSKGTPVRSFHKEDDPRRKAVPVVGNFRYEVSRAPTPESKLRYRHMMQALSLLDPEVIEITDRVTNALAEIGMVPLKRTNSSYTVDNSFTHSLDINSVDDCRNPRLSLNAHFHFRGGANQKIVWKSLVENIRELHNELDR